MSGGTMKAGVAFRIAAVAAVLAPALASAQQQTQPATPPAQPAPQTSTQTPPPPDTVGPRELRDFSLPGTTTRPAEIPPAQPQPSPASDTPPATQAAPRQAGTPPAPPPAAPRGSSVTVALPPPTRAVGAEETASAAEPEAPASGPQSQPAVEPIPVPPAASEPVPADDSNRWLWIIALAVAGLGVLAAFLSIRQRRRSVDEVGGALEAFVPPEPRFEEPAFAPISEPGPAPTAPTAPLSPGIVSTALRPWIDFEFTPLRCIVEEARATIEFEITITNSGSGIARDLLVEARLFNAGPAQDQEIGGFFAHPVGKGDAVPALAPLKSIQIKSSVSLPADQLRIFQVAGRHLFVPLIGFNALYRCGSAQGQTSRRYLVGREGQGEQMAPFRMDLGPRLFRGLGTREHHVHVRK